jgi:Signal transduction histidine kinase
LQTGFSFIMGLLVILFYLSNPQNKLNRWCAISGVFFWVGIFKQAVMYEIIPALHNILGISGLDLRFVPLHAVFTWMIYTLATPTMVIAGLYFGNIDATNSKYMRLFKLVIYIPGVVLLFFFSPLHFREYQLGGRSFWITYTIYNLVYSLILTFLAIRGVRIEKGDAAHSQKKRVAVILLPLLYYWLVSIFGVRLIDALKLFELALQLKLWQLNVFLTLICVTVFIVLAFKDGFMGLQLAAQNYNWSSDSSLMNLINANAEYASHFLKSQTTNMRMSIYLLREYYNSSPDNYDENDVVENLDIISRSISSIESYFDRIKHHSQAIRLEKEGLYRLTDLLTDAAAISLGIVPNIALHMDIDENVYIMCDELHMTEVFINIITNSVEAINEKNIDNGFIQITGHKYRTKYNIYFKDNGTGIDSEILSSIFAPRASTKSKDKNSGLGLSYSKNVMRVHSGNISVNSKQGEGTTIIIAFPSKRVTIMSD